MTRTKIQNKNISTSVSLTPYQKEFIKTHPKFDFSKFVQNHLEEYINLQLEVEKAEREVGVKVNEKRINE